MNLDGVLNERETGEREEREREGRDYKRHLRNNWGNLNIGCVLDDIMELLLFFSDMELWLYKGIYF